MTILHAAAASAAAAANPVAARSQMGLSLGQVIGLPFAFEASPSSSRRSS
jgi:hypothetical protein